MGSAETAWQIWTAGQFAAFPLQPADAFSTRTRAEIGRRNGYRHPCCSIRPGGRCPAVRISRQKTRPEAANTTLIQSP